MVKSTPSASMRMGGRALSVVMRTTRYLHGDKHRRTCGMDVDGDKSMQRHMLGAMGHAAWIRYWRMCMGAHDKPTR